MRPATETLWAKQNQHQGDRHRLFTAVANHVEGERVLYPGSFVDIAASFVWPDVTYVDIDKRTPKFFGDDEGVRSIIDAHDPPTDEPNITFIHADYSAGLDLEDESFDVLLSLYAGFVSEHCTRFLRVGGHLLVSPSHGDAALASIDERYEFVGAVIHRAGDYQVRTTGLDEFLIPKRPIDVTPELLHERGRGIAYTRSAFAYVFRKHASG